MKGLKKHTVCKVMAICTVLSLLVSSGCGKSKKTRARIGDEVTFGTYKDEEIQWIVLDKNDDGVLLLSKYVLDGHEIDFYRDVTWEECSMRAWLNDEFLNEAFSSGEQNRILTTRVVNQDNPYTGTPGGNDTDDKVFLLSVDEVEKYVRRIPDRLGQTTRYAETVTYATITHWWLRSRGDNIFYYCVIDLNGTVSYRDGTVDIGNFGVRPAIWVDL
ncbi:MAG: hypothetical protein J5379_06480 [Clostridiales bacterium]|nr:hypothetical protein [Clostridiales bacterium]